MATELAPDLRDRMKAMVHELPLPRFELLKVVILVRNETCFGNSLMARLTLLTQYLYRISTRHSGNVTIAMDLAQWWAPLLIRGNGKGSIAKHELELQVRLVQTLITPAEEVFESDPTERFADPSFSSVTLLPNVRSPVAHKGEPSKLESSSASTMSFRSLWQFALSSVPQVVSNCTRIVESDKWTSQVYQFDAP